MHHQYSQCPLQLTPHELHQVKHLVQAHRTPQAVARRASLIEIWFSILQRQLLLPNHFESLNLLEHAILDFITRYNQEAAPLKWSYTVRQLERKLAPRLRRNGELASV